MEVEFIKMSTYESLNPNLDGAEESDCLSVSEREPISSKNGSCLPTRKKLCDILTSKKFIKTVVFGQGLSILMSGTGVFSGLLQEEGVNVPTAQSFPVYCLLCILFATQLAFRSEDGDRSITQVFKQDGWKYALLGLIDVEANFLVVKAYAYTSVTSVQVLDCFSIAAVLVLSRIVLRTKYKCNHYIGVFISLVGLGGLIAADVISGKNGDAGEGKNAALGDVLVIAGAIMYGVSNVGQEFVVKNYNKCEFLGMIGLFGSLVSGIQTTLVEREDVANIDFTSYKVVLPFVGFTVCLVLIYSCMSYIIEQTSATLTNISLLSADFYSLIFGIFIFKYSFHYLYFIAFVIVIVGVGIYSLVSTSSPPPPAVVEDGDNECEASEVSR